MKQNLKLMHELKLIHKDIKPDNMLYSHQYKRYVLTDFGLSHSVEQNVGQKSKTFCEGSPFYMSRQMKDLYKTKKLGYFEQNYNYRYAIRLSFKQILQILTKQYREKLRSKIKLIINIINQSKNGSKIICLSQNNQDVKSVQFINKKSSIEHQFISILNFSQQLNTSHHYYSIINLIWPCFKKVTRIPLKNHYIQFIYENEQKLQIQGTQIETKTRRKTQL